MLVTTHTIVATTIALKTGNPWIYIPAAIFNHPILDALPHFGGSRVQKRIDFKYEIIADAILGIGFYALFITKTNIMPLQLFLLDLTAGWPDLIHVYNRYIEPSKYIVFQKYHRAIQKFESPYGIILEVTIWIICLWIIFS
jgi:hypothetical protein